MSRRQQILELRKQAPQILPSLLLCDFGNLSTEVQRLEQCGIQGLHLDVMDGNFVPNLTYGMPIVEGLRKHTALPLDVHLMIADPQDYAESFYHAGADSITFHVEAVEDPQPILSQIHDYGAAAGIALNPLTPLKRIESCVGRCDMVLIMSVQAGFGGQSFQDVALDKLVQAREMFGPDVLLEIDGGINSSTIGECVSSGAELLVVGSAIFRQPSYEAAITSLQALMAKAKSQST